jgi:endonuclease III
MNRSDIPHVIEVLRKATASFTPPLIDQIIDEYGKDPFLILIACLLSLRVKDLTTIHVCRELFNRTTTPQGMLAVPRVELERILFKTGFYRNKTRVVYEVSSCIIERFNGMVPSTYEELISIKGVGPKTANLVMGMAFGIPAICVDTHVHRISNRLGLIATKTVEQTEEELKKLLPPEHWIEWNKLLVMFGQNVCVPLSPKVSSCPLKLVCKRVGVTTAR